MAAADPVAYIAGIEDDARRADIERLDALIRTTAPELEPFMAHGMLGYGPYHYRYASGREGDTAIVGLASQKRHISLYVNCATPTGYLAESFKDRLPKADIGKSCVRFKRLADVDEAVLADLLRATREHQPAGAADT